MTSWFFFIRRLLVMTRNQLVGSGHGNNRDIHTNSVNSGEAFSKRQTDTLPAPIQLNSTKGGNFSLALTNLSSVELRQKWGTNS